jgi:hypothetical protein
VKKSSSATGVRLKADVSLRLSEDKIPITKIKIIKRLRRINFLCVLFGVSKATSEVKLTEGLARM